MAYTYNSIPSEIDETREYPPCRRMINISGRFYFLQFPYIVFTKVYRSLYCGFLTKPINANSIVYGIPLGNIYYSNLSYQGGSSEGYGVCLGDNFDDKQDENGYLEELSLNRLIDVFWKTSFRTSDWTGYFLAKTIFGEQPYRSWSNQDLQGVIAKIEGSPDELWGIKVKKHIKDTPFRLRGLLD
jgi:hypothetical protein